MPAATKDNLAKESLRDRKRRQTAQRIKEAGLKLFSANGYDATTLDEIAEAAGISRRTFFHYFKSKDEILLSLPASADDGIAPAMRAGPRDRRPIDAARDALAASCARFRTSELLAVDRLMRASDAVQARKQTFYMERERVLFEALRERWPEPDKDMSLRLVAMVSVSAFRLALDNFNRAGGKRSLVDLLHEAFDRLAQEI